MSALVVIIALYCTYTEANTYACQFQEDTHTHTHTGFKFSWKASKHNTVISLSAECVFVFVG